MKKFGIIGYPLGHSFSAKYFAEKFLNEALSDHIYSNYPIESIDQFPNVIKQNPELVGLNVTIPYKESIFEHLQELDPTAKEIGAVNVIKVLQRGGEIYLKGFNSDVFGFEQSLLPYLKKIHSKALILGTGGAAKASAWVLKKLGIDFLFVSRKPKSNTIISYDDLNSDMINEYKLIVNTSPLGMYPNVDSCPPIQYEALSNEHILFDLIYNPEKTKFLQKGEQKKAIVINGLPMLHLQAEKSWDIWTNA